VVEAITETSKVNVRRSQLFLKFVLDGTDGVVARLAQRVVGLVRDQNEGIAGSLELEKRRNHSIAETEVPRGQWGFHSAGGGIENSRIEDAVAVQKNGGPDDRAD
jgi:hypothetical protein